MNLEQDHQQIAWENWTEQFDGKPNLEALSKSLLAPASGIQSALKQLYTQRWIDTAVGAQLDGIGAIVGQPRQIPDTVYLSFFGYAEQTGAQGYGDARYRRSDESTVGGTTKLPDPEYRQIIRWKIGINNGHGTIPEIKQALKLMLGVEYISVSNQGNAKIRVFIPSSPRQSVFLPNIRKYIPVAAGVGVSIVTGGTTRPFGYSQQPNTFGYGVGAYSGVI